MNKITHTPQDAITLTLALTGMSAEEYHNQVLSAGEIHARTVVARYLPDNEELQDIVVKDLIQEHRFNFWTYFQNVVYLKNLYLIEKFGHLPSTKARQKTFMLKVWQNSLLPFRIKSNPSGAFERILAAIIKGYMHSYISKKEVAK